MLWLVHSAMGDLYPRNESLPGVAETDLDTFLRRLIREAPLKVSFGICVAAIVYAFAPLFTLGIPLPSFWLSREMRDRHAQRIAATRFYHVRQLILLLKWAASLCWGQHPSVRQAMNLEVYPSDPETWQGDRA